MRGGLEETFWNTVGEDGEGELRLIGGDFNMTGERIDKKLAEGKGGAMRIKTSDNEPTFRRMDNVNGVLQETIIDHVLSMGVEKSGSKTSDGGMDMNDHAIMIGWVEVKTETGWPRR